MRNEKKLCTDNRGGKIANTKLSVFRQFMQFPSPIFVAHSIYKSTAAYPPDI